MSKERLNLVIILFVLTGVVFINNFFMVKKVTDRVMENLKRDYVPGPYNPGFDPDKVPPRSTN